MSPSGLPGQWMTEVLVDLRRVLMHLSLTASISTKDRDIIECFLTDYERARGLR